jgi:heterodisulfide reductase subunit C
MSQTIDLTKGDKTLIKEIIELGGDSILKCYECNECTALCPPRSIDNMYRFIRLIRMVKFGLRERLIDDPAPWGCTLCNRCTELCPRKVNPSHIILAIRRFQAKELAIPMSSLEGLVNILKTGHGVISDAGKYLRKKVGLVEEPASAIKDPKALEEVRTILSRTKLAELGLV